MNENHEWVYDENYSGTCSVLRESAVDMWDGYGMGSKPECTEKATWVIFEDEEDDGNYACTRHAHVWIKNGETEFSARLCPPVSDDEVQVAIASILSVLSVTS